MLIKEEHIIIQLLIIIYKEHVSFVYYDKYRDSGYYRRYKNDQKRFCYKIK